MTFKAAMFINLAFLSLAAAQPAREAPLHRVLHFTSTRAEPALKEMSTVIRAIADIRQFSIDVPENALILEGTAAQIALAEWLFPLLDQPIRPDPAKHE